MITHPVFGVGFISEPISPEQGRITFQSDKRILIHNRRLLPLHIVQRQRQEAEVKAKADGKMKRVRA